MSAVNWREFAEELVTALDDACRELANLDAYFVRLSKDGKSAKVLDQPDLDALVLVEAADAEQSLDELMDTWRRKLRAAQIVDDRRVA